MTKQHLITALLLFLSINIMAQDKVSENIIRLNENSQSPNASLEDLKWIIGHWIGTALDGDCEETWLPAYNGRMIGTFRMTKTSKYKFFAFSTIMEVSNSLEMRVKHFNYEFRGWEEKDKYITFPLVKIDKNRAYFDGVTMEKIGENRLNVYMSIKFKDGTVKEEKYVYKKYQL